MAGSVLWGPKPLHLIVFDQSAQSQIPPCLALVLAIHVGALAVDKHPPCLLPGVRHTRRVRDVVPGESARALSARSVAVWLI